MQVRVNSVLPPDYHSKAEQLARAERRSLSNWIAALVMRYIDEQDAK